MEQFPHLAFWQDVGNLVAVSNRAAGRACSLHTRLSDQPSGLPRLRFPETQDLDAKTTKGPSIPSQLVAPSTK